MKSSWLEASHILWITRRCVIEAFLFYYMTRYTFFLVFILARLNYIVIFLTVEQVAADQPLFFLRGIQVVEQPRGTSDLAGNIAMRDWCGFPKTYDQYNEWLILNYMVSLRICRYIRIFSHLSTGLYSSFI